MSMAKAAVSALPLFSSSVAAFAQRAENSSAIRNSNSAPPMATANGYPLQQVPAGQ
jgi:hypothetical protein